MGRPSPTQPPEDIDHRALLGEARTIAARISAITDVLEHDLDRGDPDDEPT
jgi:hypothetical protein